MEVSDSQTSRYYAGVGSGATPVEIAPTQQNIAKRAARENIGLLSGGAWGSDLNYETGAIEAGGPFTVFFANPTHKQNGKYERVRVGPNYHLLSNLRHNDKAAMVIQQILDASHWANIVRKGEFVSNLMTRNAYQILNVDLRNPVEFVSLWAPADARDNSVLGGTKAAAKLATALEIPTYNLSNARDRALFTEFVRAGLPLRTPAALARTLSRMSDMGIISRDEALERAEALQIALPVTLGQPLPVIMPATFTAEHLGGAKREQTRVFAPTPTQESLLGDLVPATTAEVPLPDAEQSVGVPGLTIIRGYLPVREQARLLDFVDAQPWSHDLSRRTQHYGWRYSYDRRALNPGDYLGSLPQHLHNIGSAIGGQLHEQAIVNEYLPGQGIGAHIDHVNNFGDAVASVSLLSPATMIFERAGRQIPVTLQPGDLMQINGEARYRWTHSIPKHEGRRISVTFRSIRDRALVKAAENSRVLHGVRIGNANRNDVGDYIGRGGRQRFAPSPLRNRYIVGVDGERGECADKFRADFAGVLAGQPIAGSKLWSDRIAIQAELTRLAEKLQTQDITLVCHCAPAKCHGEAVRDAVIAMRDRKLGMRKNQPSESLLDDIQKATMTKADGHSALAHRGSIFDSRAMAVVNTVNCVGVMGKGLALEFKSRYPDMFMAYRQACQEGAVRPGALHVYDRGAHETPRFIINFPTKRHWRDDSRIDDIKLGLSALVKTVKDLGIATIAIPALGCKNGGLHWNDVEPLIAASVSEMHIEAEVYGPQMVLARATVQERQRVIDIPPMPADATITEKRGFFLIKHALSSEEIAQINAAIREIAQAAPLVRHEMPNGAKFNVEMTAAGVVGWVSDRDGYRYDATHPNGSAWPPVPAIIEMTTRRALRAAGLDAESLQAHSVLVNRYAATNRLGMHQDKDEKINAPVISFSLGASADMQVENDTYRLDNGDICILSGESRMARHGITAVYATEEYPFRDNLTVRDVHPMVLEQARERAARSKVIRTSSAPSPVVLSDQRVIAGNAKSLLAEPTEKAPVVAEGSHTPGGITGTVIGNPTFRTDDLASLLIRDPAGNEHRVIAHDELATAVRTLHAGDTVTVRGEREQRPVPGGGLITAVQATSITASGQHERARVRDAHSNHRA